VSIVVASEFPSKASLATSYPLGHAFGCTLVEARHLRPLPSLLLVWQRTVGAFGDHPSGLAELCSRLLMAAGYTIKELMELMGTRTGRWSTAT
jgi:hypothetical protein